MEFRDGLDCHRSWDVALFMALVSCFVSGTALVFLVLRMIFDLLRQSEIHSHHKNWLQNWVHLKLAGESMIKVSPAVQWASPSGIGYWFRWGPSSVCCLRLIYNNPQRDRKKRNLQNMAGNLIYTILQPPGNTFLSFWAVLYRYLPDTIVNLQSCSRQWSISNVASPENRAPRHLSMGLSFLLVAWRFERSPFFCTSTDDFLVPAWEQSQQGQQAQVSWRLHHILVEEGTLEQSQSRGSRHRNVPHVSLCGAPSFGTTRPGRRREREHSSCSRRPRVSQL